MTDDDVLQQAKKYFSSGYNCAQTVFRCVLEEKGVHINQATDIAAGLGAGISYMGVTCGAVSGAIMVLGVLNGLEEKEANTHKKKTYTAAQEFLEKFKDKHGTTGCNELLGIDIGDPDARKQASDSGVFRTVCPQFIYTAIETVLEMYP